MQTLKELSWKVVEKEIFGKEEGKRKTFALLRAKKENEKRKGETLRELAGVVGWIEPLKAEWKIAKKQISWKHIHRDIVSTVMLGNTMEHMYRS